VTSSSVTRAQSPSPSKGGSASDASASSPPRKRLRKFSETPKKSQAERLERLAQKRRKKAKKEDSEISDEFIVSDEESEESENSLGFYANADRELFVEREQMAVEMAAERNFPAYLEYVAFALAAVAAQTGWSADELARYKGVVGKFEKEVFTRRDAALGRWSAEMRADIEKFPTLTLSREAYSPGTLCQACNRKGDTVVEATLSGNFYDTRKFHGKISDLVRATETAVAEFLEARARTEKIEAYLTLSAHCAKKVEDYHQLHHWKWRIFIAVYRWLMENRKCFETATQAAEVMKADTAFIQRMQIVHNRLCGDDCVSDDF
jgi:hypothetical protein